MKYSTVKEYETIKSYFPDALAITHPEYSTFVQKNVQTYAGDCEYFEVTEIQKKLCDISNLDVSNDIRVTLCGIDNNFFKYPFVTDDTSYGFNKLIFSNNQFFSEEMFAYKGMFAVVPEKMIERKDFNKFQLFGKPVRIINTYTNLFDNNSPLKIFLPITTFRNELKSDYTLMKSSLYVNINSGSGFSNEKMGKSFTKNNLIIKTNNIIDEANSAFSLFISLYAIASISICVLCLVTIKNRYNEIGIKMAIGARKIDIILELIVENLGVILISSLVASIFSIFTCTVVQSIISIRNSIYVVMINFPLSIFCLCMFLLFSIISIIVPSFMGANSNIEKILKEER